MSNSRPAYILHAMRTLLPPLGLVGLAGLLCGCAASGSTGCNLGTAFLQLEPSSGTAKHSVAAPGNEQRFTATEDFTGGTGGCPVPAVVPVILPAWTSSDPVDVTVSSALDATNGLATCVNATLAPVTLTATEGSGTTALTASVTMTCN